jgi:ParB family chromosome partitioning protein
LEKNNLEKNNLEKSNLEKNKPLDKSRLGRGLSSLIPPSVKAPVAERPAAVEVSAAPSPLPLAAPTAPEPESGIRHIPLDKIKANTYQPRTEFDTAALQELTESVALHGVLQPVMVRPSGGGRYELIAGERRFRAAQQSGLTHIPAVIREMTDEESLVVALIENIQREDLNAMEAARGYKQLLDQFGLTQVELARQIGKSPSTIAYALSLLRLPLEMQESIARGEISMDHGKVLLSVASPERRTALFGEMVSQGLSVVASRRRAAEELAAPSRLLRTVPDIAEELDPDGDIHLKAIEDRLRSALGLKVTIRNGRTGRGVVTVDFSDMNELETIIDRIVG